MSQEILQHPWKFRAEPFRIAGNLYYVGNRDVSVHLVDTGDGLLLIDTGYPQTVYLLLESIWELGFRPENLRYILLTHAHYDHIGGVRPLVELFGCETFLGREDLSFLTTDSHLTWHSEFGMTYNEYFEPTHAIEDGQVIRLGNTAVKAVHSPGHTPGTYSFFLEVEENGRQYRAGMHGGIGLNTLQKEYLERYRLGSQWREWYKTTLDRLEKERVDILLGNHPGQSATFEKYALKRENPNAPNPFVHPDEWRHFIANTRSNYQSFLLAEDLPADGK